MWLVSSVSCLLHLLHLAAALCQQCGLEDVAEDRTPPGPGAVGDDVGRVGAEWSVVCVELARLVTGTVVVRVTDRWHRTVDHALHTTFHLSIFILVHLLSTYKPNPVQPMAAYYRPLGIAVCYFVLETMHSVWPQCTSELCTCFCCRPVQCNCHIFGWTYDWHNNANIFVTKPVKEKQKEYIISNKGSPTFFQNLMDFGSQTAKI